MPHPTRSQDGAAPRQFAVRLLGRFTVEVDGAEVPTGSWPSLRSAQLVQLLSLTSARALPREQVIETLWPRLDPQAGAANLRKAAHHARQALRHRDAVLLRGGQVMLCPGMAAAVDATEFERRADAALARHDPAACVEAASLYEGDLLPGSPYEEWTGRARAQLRSRYLELLRASGEWERLARAEPTDEPTHRALMQRELAAGNRAAAIGWYSRLRTNLQQAFGVAPERETEALYARCIEGLGPKRAMFVGRDAELARAIAWLAVPPAERAGGLLLRGPAGIGKTAFCREFAAAARARGWTVMRVDAAEPDRPHAVIAEAVDQLVLQDRAVLDRVGEAARAVLALLSPLVGPAHALPGPLGRHQVIGAFRKLLLAASHGGCVMLQIDDAHLLEDADVDTVLHLCIARHPVFTVLASRTPAPQSALARGVTRLLDAGQLVALDLQALSNAEAAAVAAHAAGRPLAARVVDRVVQLAEGNPFAAVELARCAGLGAATPLPANAAQAVIARLCDLAPPSVARLQALAIAGDGFDASMAAALCADEESEAVALLDAALAGGILVVLDGQYRFQHELVRQALVDEVAPHRRLKMHRDAAQRLARLGAAPALIARQWLAGGSPAQAVPWFVAAARDTLRVAAFSDALRHLEPVLAYNARHPEALRLRAEALDAIGDPAAPAAYRLAAELAGADADDLRAKAALAQIKQGDPRGGLQALQGLQPRSVEGRLSEALAYCGAAALGVADPAAGTQKVAQLRRLALDTGDRAALVIASWAQAAAAHARGELHSSVWADLRETSHVPHLAMRVFDGQLCIAQRFLYGGRPYPEVIAFAQALATEAERLGAARGHAFGVTLRGEAELLSGDLQAAQRHLREGAQLHHAIGGATGEAFSLQRLSEVALYRDERDEARALLDAALEIARETDVGFHLMDRIYGTRMALAAGPDAAGYALDEARHSVRGPLETCPGCRITFAVPAAIAAARARRLDLAQEYERASEYLANVVMRLPAWYAALDEVRGHIALARDQGEAASNRFAAAASAFRAAGHPLDAARCESLAGGGLSAAS